MQKASATSTPSPIIRIALVQYLYEGSLSLPQLTDKFSAYLTQCLALKPDVIVFPELWVLDMVARDASEPAAGRLLNQHSAAQSWEPIYQIAQDFAAKHEIYVLSGTFPVSLGDKIVNRAILMDPLGHRYIQDKLTLTPDEKIYGWHAGAALQSFSLPIGKLAILICYDSEVPQLSAQLCDFDPELILIPSMTSEKGLQRVQRCAAARAVEHHAYVAMTGIADQATGPEYHSQAQFLAPLNDGFAFKPVVATHNQSEIIHADVSLADLRAAKLTSGFFPARDYQKQR